MHYFHKVLSQAIIPTQIANTTNANLVNFVSRLSFQIGQIHVETNESTCEHIVNSGQRRYQQSLMPTTSV